LVVIGAGGAGLSTALFAAIDGAKVLVVERTEYVGGTTAWSAGTTWVPGTPAHSWQAVAAGGTSIGVDGAQVAARVLALTAGELFQSPDVLKAARGEMNQRRGEGFVYRAMLGDAAPKLDYRKP
jgi:succinate dehydrogenase/fumarate reductase flavoprotein subunit